MYPRVGPGGHRLPGDGRPRRQDLPAQGRLSGRGRSQVRKPRRVPASGKWALDATLNWVKQRDFNGGFGFQDYSVVTGLVSLQTKLPVLPGTYFTMRAGRFLAGDEGVRFELKRRFRSGFEFGIWYTRTNGNDITSPGSPSNPYYDKGIFIVIPFAAILPRDTQTLGGVWLAPWTRDVGQMVAQPGNLMWMFERPVINVTDHDGLEEFGEVNDRYPQAPPRQMH